jgi:hypothetical protein
MILFDVLFAIGIGLLFTAIFAGLFGRTGPWASIPVFFALIFLAAWVGGVWLAPLGPAIFGVYWIPYLIFGLIVALVLAAAAQPVRTIAGQQTGEGEEEQPTRRVFDGFFFILVAVLVIAIVVGYLV